MADLEMATTPAKNQADLRTEVVELERKVRAMEDLSDERVSDLHQKSILISLLDPVTRAHTSAFQGAGTSYADFRRIVLEFANNTSASISGSKADPNAMVIGALGTDLCEEVAEDNGEEVVLAAVTPSTKCHNCGDYGHIAAKCPSPKVGKGGKGSKGRPKGGLLALRRCSLCECLPYWRRRQGGPVGHLV